jgi:Ca2+-binding RTX toxin-like protein
VVHNDDDQDGADDIALAQIDEQSGALVKDVPLAGTDGFTIRSSALLTEAGAGGDRVLFFVAENGDDERVFRVPVTNAASADAALGPVTSTADVDADPDSSPTLAWLRDAAGQLTAYVAVGTGAPASSVKTFAESDLAPGPVSGDLGDTVRTPAVPVQTDGTTPGPPGGAPAILAAAAVGSGTVVHRLVQTGNDQSLTTAASSPALGGAPAPALSTDAEVTSAGLGAGSVVVSTGENLYRLDAGTLALGATFSTSALSPGTTGFGQTTGALANGLAYVTTDDGRQLVLGVDDLSPLAAADFTENPVNAAARPAGSAFGQPSLSRSFVQFASQHGLFVYANRCGNPIAGSAGADRIADGPAGSEIRTFAGNDKVSGRGGDDCIFGGTGDDALSGNGGDDRVSAGTADDRVFGRAGDDAISGNAGSDRVLGGLGADRVFGRKDDDRVAGGPGDDLVHGNPGDDGASGNAGDDVVRGGPGDDRIFGRAGDDRLSGNAGNDRIFAGAGSDRVFGRGGSDRIHVRDGVRDVVFCGTGRDRVIADRLDVLRGCESASRR